jgi:hypothetical protein
MAITTEEALRNYPKLRVAARALVNVWNIGERRGGEHDLDQLNALIERLERALQP